MVEKANRWDFFESRGPGATRIVPPPTGPGRPAVEGGRPTSGVGRAVCLDDDRRGLDDGRRTWTMVDERCWTSCVWTMVDELGRAVSGRWSTNLDERGWGEGGREGRGGQAAARRGPRRNSDRLFLDTRIVPRGRPALSPPGPKPARLAGQSVRRPAGWPAGWLAGWLAGWPNGWLAGSFTPVRQTTQVPGSIQERDPGTRSRNALRVGDSSLPRLAENDLERLRTHVRVDSGAGRAELVRLQVGVSRYVERAGQRRGRG